MNAAAEPRLSIDIETALARRPQNTASAVAPAQPVKNRIRTVGLHLMDDAQQLAQTSLGKAGLAGEPAEVLRRQIVDGQALRRVSRGAILAKGHARAADLFEIRAHPGGEVVHAGTRARTGTLVKDRSRLRGRRHGFTPAPMKAAACLCLALLGLLTSCRSLEAPVHHASDLSGSKSFHIPQAPDDRLGLADLIATEMNAQGFTTRAGGKPAAGDSRLSYRWELLPGRTDRLGRLTLKVNQPNGESQAGSRSDQPASLMPADNTEMVRLAVRNLLAATPGPNGRPRGSLMERETLLW